MFRLVASHTPPARGLACNPGLCPAWESNWGPFGLWDNAQTTKPHQSGPIAFLKLSFTLAWRSQLLHVKAENH